MTIDSYFWLSLSIQGKGHCLPATPRTPPESLMPTIRQHAYTSSFFPDSFLATSLPKRIGTRTQKLEMFLARVPSLTGWTSLPSPKVDNIRHIKHQLQEDSGEKRKKKIKSRVFSNFPIRNDAALLMVLPLRKAASPFLLKRQLSLSHFAVKARCSNVEHVNILKNVQMLILSCSLLSSRATV